MADGVTAHGSGGGGRRRVNVDEAAIDAIFADIDPAHEPGAAVGIAVHGEPVYRKAFGLANMELPVALATDMRMRVYSVSKHFTCLSYLLLCEEGKAALDDPIGRHLPELHPIAREVSVRNLMANVSGLRDVHDINWVFSGFGRRVTSASLLDAYRDIADVNFPPRTGWAYNNGGFLLLTAAIERIEQRPLEDVLRSRIFEPAGLRDTLLRRFDDDFVPNSATMHMIDPDGGFDRTYLGAAMAGEGGVVSTVDDLLRWLAHMDRPVVGSSGSWALMREPTALANGRSTHYALALAHGCHRGAPILFHSGGGFGAHSQMLKATDAGLDIVVLTNRYDRVAADYANRILDLCLADLAPEPAATSSAAVGTFHSPATGRIVQLFVRDGRQMAWIDNDMEMAPDDLGTLRPAGKFMLIRQAIELIGPREAPDAIRLDDFGNVDTLERVGSPVSGELRRIAGRYRAESIGVDAVVEAMPDGARFRSTGRFGSTEAHLEPLGEGVWRTRLRWPWMGGGLSFDSDGRGFRFSTARSRALRFERIG